MEVIQSSIKGETSGGAKRVSLSSSPVYEKVKEVEWISIELPDEITDWINLQGLLSLTSRILPALLRVVFGNGHEFFVLKGVFSIHQLYFLLPIADDKLLLTTLPGIFKYLTS